MKKIIAAAVLVLFNTTAVMAADESGTSRTLIEPRVAGFTERQPSIGGFTGYTDTEGNRSPGVAYGIEFGLQPLVPMGAGVELSGYTANGKGDTPGLTRTKLIGKWNYNFGGMTPLIRYSYVGVGLGPVVDNQSNKYDIALGMLPQAGFDIPLAGTQVSLGANTSYMFVTDGKDDVFALNGIAKYWY